MMRLAGTVGRLPRYIRLGRVLFDEPAIPRRRKVGLAAGIGYAILPFDLLPGIIPVVGQLDDLGALLLGLRHTLRGCPPEIARRHLEDAGLTHQVLDDDLRTVGVATVWIGQKALVAGKAIARGAARFMRHALSGNGKRSATP
jgi:uncharacterized membrane protein YkvA (DUF1232 family)